MLTDDRAELGVVPFDRSATGFDEGLEALFGIVATHRILANLEAQKVKADFAALWLQGMGKARLGGMEFQSQLLEPLAQEPLAMVDHRRVAMQDDEIIGKANHLQFPAYRFGVSIPWRPNVFARRELGTEILFHAMERHVRQ